MGLQHFMAHARHGVLVSHLVHGVIRGVRHGRAVLGVLVLGGRRVPSHSGCE